MGRTSSFIVGTTIGVLAATVLSYLFGAARGTTFDQHYRSRWDQALADGQQAAMEHEEMLRRQLAVAKQAKPSSPDTP